jgi:outer membrane protein assembly factor BamE (lipoprotein component of BamABCDE complex)
MSGRVLMVVAAALLASACTRIPNNIGYIVDEQLATSIQPGVDNKQSVQATLGRPSFGGGFDDRQWYYVSRQTKQYAFLKPKPSLQSIIIVNFDAQGNVAGVERRGLEKVANIDPVDDKTPTLGRETGILEDLFGNIGRFGSAPVGNAPQ